MTNKNAFTKDVNFINYKSCQIDKTVTFGKNVTIYPNNIIKGKTHISDNTTIKANNYISDCIILENTEIEYSFLEQSEIGKNVKIGPFSRIRPNSKIGDNCKIGNFVEVKNSTLKQTTKASHLAYIGDSIIGQNCNIGCGAIFVNYNGKEKNQTIVGNNCFIGSNVNLIAPLNINDNTYICAGTTLTQNTNEYDFVIGRVKETIKPQRAKKYLKENK